MSPRPVHAQREDYETAGMTSPFDWAGNQFDAAASTFTIRQSGAVNGAGVDDNLNTLCCAQLLMWGSSCKTTFSNDL
jgi:hypothetical protein